MSKAQAPGVSEEDIKDLKAALARNDRAGMYLRLYQLTGDEFWLMDAQITSFSGVWGGTALRANFEIKVQNKELYEDSLDHFSLTIAGNMLKWVEGSVREGRKGYVELGDLLMKGDGEIWRSKGLINQYPGRVLFLNLGEYRFKELIHVVGTGSIYSFVAVFKDGRNLGKRPADYAGNPNFSTFVSKEDRFVTVVDKRTCKVEAFFDRKTTALGVVGQIEDRALVPSEADYHERLWIWEFMQGNQDTAEQYSSSVWLQNAPVPSPNLFENYFRNSQTGKWINRTFKREVTDPDLLDRLERYRSKTMELRKSQGLPPEPVLPNRYLL
ncbi:MAG: hypothetical protein J7501_04735 [Bdellovibrio sp.]|nr:hypothetical protein [Bdellovibrio sp.]